MMTHTYTHKKKQIQVLRLPFDSLRNSKVFWKQIYDRELPLEYEVNYIQAL